MSNHTTQPILWIDLETTGSEPDKDYILEIGAIVTSGYPDYTEGARFQAVIEPFDKRRLFSMDEAVVRMHSANGLIEELLLGHSIPLERARNQFTAFVYEYFPESVSKIQVGGSGICHFDRKFLKRDFGVVEERFEYWSWDVGVLRRALQQAGVPLLDLGKKSHRALDDAILHSMEMRSYMHAISKLVPEVGR